ncbi:hypothetical protein HPP92_011281 [Vanilla planifolia]|uniref:Reverse transcriptase zinc-binding domain-containing protein n=1 Tax=Vanilla planifolia TaxID=51239 RepID=A0A835RB61_VANPL|nr:hypothetical protein HPP92_011281 [Vanilla planifolia]
MAAYIFTARSPPLKSVSTINSLLANFFWGNSSCLRHHWAAWNKMARPISQQGIGIINLGAQIRSQTAKLWWRLLHTTSPWSRFLIQAYMIRDDIRATSRDSYCWRRLVNFFNNLLFVAWRKKRFENSPSPTSTVRPVQIVMATQITGSKQSNRSCKPTKLDWSLARSCSNSRGFFSSATAYGIFCATSLPPVPIRYDHNKLIWHKRIPLRVSILIWRLLNDALPLPHKIQSIGISMAQKCPFCPQIDTLEHIFWHCSITKPTWSWFERRLDINIKRPTIPRIFNWWSYKSTISSLAFSIPATICWMAWKNWNSAIHKGSAASPERFLWDTQKFLTKLYLIRPTSQLFSAEILSLAKIGLM